MTARLLALPALALATLAALPAERPAHGLELTAHGALRIDNSRSGAAILTAARMRPGATASGTVAIVNRSAGPVRMQLRSSAPTGGLGEVLELDVPDVASGTLADVAGCHDLGTLGGGERRTYRFSVRLPRAVGNAYAGASASVDERWIAGSGCDGRVAGAPKARAALSHRTVALVRGRALLRIRCSGPRGGGCTGRVALAARRMLSRRIAAAAVRGVRFDVPAGRTATLLVPVPRASRTALRARRRAVAAAVLRGSFETKRRLVTLIRTARRGDG